MFQQTTPASFHLIKEVHRCRYKSRLYNLSVLIFTPMLQIRKHKNHLAWPLPFCQRPLQRASEDFVLQHRQLGINKPSEKVLFTPPSLTNLVLHTVISLRLLQNTPDGASISNSQIWFKFRSFIRLLAGIHHTNLYHRNDNLLQQTQMKVN